VSERTSYEPGVPSCVDVSSPDLEASKRFYAGLFGSDALAGPVEETGGYAMFQLDGRNVAGLAPSRTRASLRCGRPTSPPTTPTPRRPASPRPAATSSHDVQRRRRPVAGAMPTPSGVPDGVPAFWLNYFSVEDCDASMAKVQELGGSTMGSAYQLEGVGRFAVVADPRGATFGVIAGEPPEE
jgi:predicted enzyme related to lactoylglutathione lyase